LNWVEDGLWACKGFKTLYPVKLPVRPVNSVFEDGERMRMEQIVATSDNLLSARSVVVTEIDEVQFRVGEVNSLVGDVQSETVRPVDLRVDDDASVVSVHSDSFNARVFAPVRPEEPPSTAQRENVSRIDIDVRNQNARIFKRQRGKKWVQI